MMQSKRRGLLKKAIAVVLGITMACGSLMLPERMLGNEFTSVSAENETVTYKNNKFEFIFRRVKGVRIAVLDSVEISDSAKGVVKIPSAVMHEGKEYPVTMVNNRFMNGKEDVKEVVFPESVKYIGYDVLQNSSVEKITLPDGLEHLGTLFAADCSKLKKVTYNGTSIKGNDMGKSVFKNSRAKGLKDSGILDDNGIKTLGNWLLDVPADLKGTKLKVSGLSKNGVPIDSVAPYAACNLKNITTVDLKGVKYICGGGFSDCEKLEEIINGDDLMYVKSNPFSSTPWYNTVKDNDLTLLGKVVMYYKTDADTIDFTSGEFAGTSCVAGNALRDCENLETVYCTSDFTFGGDCFYVAHDQTGPGESKSDRLPDISTHNISSVYLDGELLTYSRLIDDADANDWLLESYEAFEGSEAIKTMTLDKTKALFDQMGITYYGLNNDKFGTLTPKEEFYIRLKIHNYIAQYDYNHYNIYSGFVETYLLGGEAGCGPYAELTHFLLHCAGVQAKTYYANPEDESGTHYWNSTKIGDEWFESDDGWDAQGERHNYGWFGLSTSKCEESTMHRFLYGYDTWHSDPNEDGRTPQAIAERTIGDVDGNGERNKDDALLLWSYIKKKTESIDEKAADINFDGVVNVTDAVLLENFVNGSSVDEDQLPADGLATPVKVAFLNGKNYDYIEYLYTDREGYITLPDDLFPVPPGAKLSYNIGRAGQEVRITEPLKVVKVEWEYDTTPDYRALGDVNSDGVTDIEDAVAIIQHINGTAPLTSREEKRADVTQDGIIDIDDAVTLISYINGNSTF